MAEVTLKPNQGVVFQSDARFRVLVAGRRFGKTFLALVELLAACKSGRLVWYVAPTIKQAKRIAWKSLKQLTRPYWAGKPNETDLRIEIRGGGTICLRGADNYDSLRGDGLDFVVLDEYASMAREAWTEVLRPALADRQGRALFIGTPHGYNHFYDLYQEAADKPDWAVFQFTTEQGGNVAWEELEKAAHELDERTYRQEFQACFENLTAGMVYYAFKREEHVHSIPYRANLPLFWSLDFNISPMCSVIGQRDGEEVRILAEIVLEESNTESACEAFMELARDWLARARAAVHIDIYGDATGKGRHSAASQSDWQIVRDFFSHYHGYEFAIQVPPSNPPVKDRVCCVNAMLRNRAGERRLLVDRSCKHLIQDFERVHWKRDPFGSPMIEIDKSDPKRSHLSDAVGYMIAQAFPIQGRYGEVPHFLV